MTETEIRHKIAAVRDKYKVNTKPELMYWLTLAENQLNELRELRRLLKQLSPAELKRDKTVRYIGKGRSFVRWDPSFGITLNLYWGFVHYCKQHGWVFSRKYIY